MFLCSSCSSIIEYNISFLDRHELLHYPLETQQIESGFGKDGYGNTSFRHFLEALVWTSMIYAQNTDFVQSITLVFKI